MEGGILIQVHPDFARHPILLRPGTSDEAVVIQIFHRLDYRRLCSLSKVELVVDCGANIGCSAAFFLSQFPGCKVIALEPDPGNFEVLERNMQWYGDRAILLRNALWSHDTGLVLSRGRYRDNADWSTQVRTANAGEAPDVDAISMQTLFSRFQMSRIHILKVDIEGAEAVVFANPGDWLDKVDSIAIELHNDSDFGDATSIFHRAIQSRNFDVSKAGELTLCLPH
jgi:FkbM family methyltransferase